MWEISRDRSNSCEKNDEMKKWTKKKNEQERFLFERIVNLYNYRLAILLEEHIDLSSVSGAMYNSKKW